MAKNNRTHVKAVRLLAKRAATLKANLHCCIPTCTNKPEIDDSGNGSKVGPAPSEYTTLRDTRKKYLREHYRTRTRSKTPWYMLTSGKCWNNGTRVSSEIHEITKKYKIPKFSREQYCIGIAKDACQQWQKTHPIPQKEIGGTKNAFYQTEYSAWVEERAQVWDKRLHKIKNLPKKVSTNFLKQTHPELLKAA